MKKNCILLLLFIIILISLFYPKKIEYFSAKTCQVSDGDKKIGLDLRYDQSCIDKGGGLGCQPGPDGKPNGCRFCATKPNNTPYQMCSDTPPSATCTAENQDPFSSQCSPGQYVPCCSGMDLSYVNGNIECVKSSPPQPKNRCENVHCSPPQSCDPKTGKCVGPPINRCENVHCSPPQSCDPKTGHCVGPPLPPPSGDCSDPDGVCKNHIDYVNSHINDYVKNGLKPNDENNSPLIQQYLYTCETGVCKCNSRYGSSKKDSINRFGWNCHPDKCAGVKCDPPSNCDPNTGKCSGAKQGPYTLAYNPKEMADKINVASPASKNYIIVIGDWGGKESGMQATQIAIAEQMKSYVKYMKNKKMNLLFIATTGDNFYWSGLKNQNMLKEVWYDIYSDTSDPDKDLTKYPWFPVFGNHDWGNNDQYAACPPGNKKTVNTANYSSSKMFTHPNTAQAYGSNQLNSDKGGFSGTGIFKNYYMPDFSYHFAIPSLNFEYIAMEANYLDGPHDIGGDGPEHGAAYLAKNCGGATNLMNKLHDIYQASLTMLTARAKDDKSGTTNFLISNHYPGRCDYWYNTIKKYKPNSTVKCVWGHVHQVVEMSGDGDKVLTGGGGGCCNGSGDGPLGFYAYGFTDDGPKIINIGRCVASFSENKKSTPWTGKACPN